MEAMLTPEFLFAFNSMDLTELVILLVIILAVFWSRWLPRLMNGMVEHKLHQFREDMGMRQDEVWQFNDGRQRQLNEPPKTDQNQDWIVWLVFGGAALMLIAVGVEEEISTKQMLVALGVPIVCLLAWWLCFRKEKN